MHVHEAGPEVWPTMLCWSMFLANVQTIILVALHSEWSIQVKRTGDGRPIIEMLRQLCIASIHLVIMLGVATESGIELLCKPGDLGNPSFFKSPFYLYGTMLLIQVVLVLVDKNLAQKVASEAQQRQERSMTCSSGRFLTSRGGLVIELPEQPEGSRTLKARLSSKEQASENIEMTLA